MRVLLLSENKKELTGVLKGLQERCKEEIAVKALPDPHEAESLLKGYEFDLFLVDLDLQALDERDKLSGLLISSSGMPAIITGSRNLPPEEALALGADDYILKSDLSPALLENSIRHIHKHKKMEKKLRDKEEQIVLTARHSPVLILKQDKDLRYTWSNNSFLGYSAEELKGKTDMELLPAEDALILQAIKKQVMESSIKTRKIVKTKAKGRDYYYDIGIEPDYDKHGTTKGVVSTALDITDKKSVEREFLRAKSLLEKMFASLNEAVFVSERSTGRIIACNPVVEKIFGYKPNEVIGKSPEFLFHSLEHYENLKRTRELQLERNNVFRTEYQMKRKDGTAIDTEHTTNLLKKSKGWDEVLITIVSDITERKRNERALISAKEKAEKSDRLKTEFLAQISHEIRTPVNTILTYSSLMKEESDLRNDDEMKKYFKIVEKAGKRLFRTVDLIVNMSEIQTGNYELYPRELDLYYDVMLSLFVEFRKYALDKGIEIELVKNTSEMKVVADEYSISQVFRSLIDNAVKYTDRGKISIKIGKDGGERLAVSVEDTGIGISESYLPRLFEPFSQEDQSYTRSYQGNGLGLALAKKYAELNNAAIEVKSTKGSGTVFRVVFQK
ncbi:MAG TPA: PAS domain S-box protein [Ignavibacteriales bacterium]|nr:PAS domain S-box protein [Ignavibacteriales bacterium]